MIDRHDAFILAAAIFACHLAAGEAESQSTVTPDTLEHVREVDARSVGHAEAVVAMRTVNDVSANDLLPTLRAMSGANPLARNWLRNLAERAAEGHSELPEQELLTFLEDRSNGPFARSLAYELLLDRDDGWRAKLLPQMLDDPSRELRWAAVERLLEQAKTDANDAARVATLKRALDASRETHQITAIAESLDELGHPVDLCSHYGFVVDWQVIGPFDNTDQQGFHVGYPPEADRDTRQSHAGKEALLAWKSVHSSSEEGIIDLNEELGKVKGAIAYALAEFHADHDGPAEVRLGCINANKVWWNGERVMAHEKYHQAMMIDQYRAAVTMRPGKNTILVKVCQNEQTEPWAQRWRFQLRVSTPDGRAMRSKP